MIYLFCGLTITAENYLTALECPYTKISDTGSLTGPCPVPECNGENIPEGRMRQWCQKCANGEYIWDAIGDAPSRVSWSGDRIDKYGLTLQYTDLSNEGWGLVHVGCSILTQQLSIQQLTALHDKVRVSLDQLASNHPSWAKVCSQEIRFVEGME